MFNFFGCHECDVHYIIRNCIFHGSSYALWCVVLCIVVNIGVADERAVTFPETLEMEAVLRLKTHISLSLAIWRSTPEESSVYNIHFRIKYICRFLYCEFLTYIYIYFFFKAEGPNYCLIKWRSTMSHFQSHRNHVSCKFYRRVKLLNLRLGSTSNLFLLTTALWKMHMLMIHRTGCMITVCLLLEDSSFLEATCVKWTKHVEKWKYLSCEAQPVALETPSVSLFLQCIIRLM